MLSFPNSQKILKGGLVLIDANTSAVQRIIVLPYAPDALGAPCNLEGAGQKSGNQIGAVRLSGLSVNDQIRQGSLSQ